ncbi:TyrR/PhhR family helix-turn-helix DNA-binding protein [Escherichia coli]
MRWKVRWTKSPAVFERSVLTQLYRNYPSTRKLAKRLGVSHCAIANKLREYGLSQKKRRVSANMPDGATPSGILTMLSVQPELLRNPAWW